MDLGVGWLLWAFRADCMGFLSMDGAKVLIILTARYPSLIEMYPVFARGRQKGPETADKGLTIRIIFARVSLTALKWTFRLGYLWLMKVFPHS